MKARIKGFDTPFREIETLTMKGINGTYFADDVEFEQKPQPVSDHWQDVRERAAIAAMQGVMNFFGSIDYSRETIAELAVMQADALVEKLKGE